MRTIIIGLVVAFTVVPAFANFDEWIHFFSPDKGFEILFPNQPEHTTEITEKSVGNIATEMWLSKYDGGIFIAGVTNYPIDLDTKTEFDLDVANFVKSFGGNLKAQSDITISGYSVRQFSGTRDTYDFGGRVLMDGHRRVYIVAAALPQSTDQTLPLKFAESFKILKSALAK